MKRRIHPFRSCFFVFFLLYMVWVVLLFLAPLRLPAGSVSDLSGVVGSSDNDLAIREMPFPWDAVYSVGDRLCHQKSERSLFLNGNEMPFCARCTAIFVGLAGGLGFMVLYTIELDEKFFVAIVLSLVPIGVDGVGQLFGFWESINLIRFLTGLLIGITCGMAIGLIIDEIKTIHFHQKKND